MSTQDEPWDHLDHALFLELKAFLPPSLILHRYRWAVPSLQSAGQPHRWTGREQGGGENHSALEPAPSGTGGLRTPLHAEAPGLAQLPQAREPSS